MVAPDGAILGTDDNGLLGCPRPSLGCERNDSMGLWVMNLKPPLIICRMRYFECRDGGEGRVWVFAEQGSMLLGPDDSVIVAHGCGARDGCRHGKLILRLRLDLSNR